MNNYQQQKINATYMRGGTSKGVFFNKCDLPVEAQTAGEERNNIVLRVLGSPDPYGKQVDGMGGATSSTSKVAIVSKSKREGHDVDYLFGQVSIGKPLVDWSGNCGNLTAAVGAFAINHGLIDQDLDTTTRIVKVRIWQVNIQKTIIANVPVCNGRLVECGDFELDGVTFPSAKINIEFIQPVDVNDALFPTGNKLERLEVPELGSFDVTMINAGIPTIFIKASDLGYLGTELQDDINNSSQALEQFETIRAYGALKMGLIKNLREAATQQHTPKIAMIAEPQTYDASSGKKILKEHIDLSVRALSMGKLHHAMMGTAAVAVAAANSVPGTLVNLMSKGENSNVTFGHPSGTLKVAANTSLVKENWTVNKVVMSRSARILMEGQVRIPSSYQLVDKV
ncbi:2-methylaconitate cis-trans isomerase PrpF [Paraglaciecola sp.]|uniref:2-methylaconitate cis-trans isomerase PrpF n=1 Tax=Paraglaciecola sp. TaxID=1920173 RepID=UPI003EF3E247